MEHSPIPMNFQGVNRVEFSSVLLNMRSRDTLLTYSKKNPVNFPHRVEMSALMQTLVMFGELTNCVSKTVLCNKNILHIFPINSHDTILISKKRTIIFFKRDRKYELFKLVMYTYITTAVLDKVSRSRVEMKNRSKQGGTSSSVIFIDSNTLFKFFSNLTCWTVLVGSILVRYITVCFVS